MGRLSDSDKKILADAYRIDPRRSIWLLFFTDKVFRQLFFFRKYQGTDNKVTKFFWRLCLFLRQRKSTVEIPKTVQLGMGALFFHPNGITINSKAVIGDNLTMLKGATIGQIEKGKRKGVPVIGNNVYLGLNSTVVGGIELGDDVLVAPNTFINFSVPSHSVVIGNPGKIYHKEMATDGYVINADYKF